MIPQSKIIISVIVGLVATGIVGIVAYRYSEQWQIVEGISVRNVEKVVVVNAPVEAQKSAVATTAPTPAKEMVQVPKTAMSPKETYIQMMTEYNNIKTYDDIEAVASKYGSKAVIANTESKEESQARKNFMSMSEAEKDQLITQIKRQLSSIEINTIQESVNGSTATVSVRSTSGWKSTVILVLENNQWKVDNEYFK